jgi:hypothetical protein
MGQGVRRAAVPPVLVLVAALVLAAAGCDRTQPPWSPSTWARP